MRQYSTRIVCEFNTLFDIEFGIIKVIQKNFNIQHNGEYIFNQFTLNTDDNGLKTLILTDEDDNLPALLTRGITGEESLDLAKYICDQCHTENKWYHKAIDMALRTSICKLTNMWTKADIAIVTVLCKNPLEQQIIKQLYPGYKTVVGEYIDLSSYSVIYIRRFADILRYHQAGKLAGKEIIVPTYWSNMQPEDRYRPKTAISYLIGSINKIKTINPYDNFQLPVDEDN